MNMSYDEGIVGTALVCVRYREDREGQRQYTTVELVVSDRTSTHRGDGEVLLRIDYRETQLRAMAKQAGTTWDPAAKLWRTSRSAARACGLAERIVGKKREIWIFPAMGSCFH